MQTLKQNGVYMTWLTTFSGKEFDYEQTKPESICIEDIAMGLSHECRFAGQLKEHYSVAQHSIECSYIVPEKFALEALLHDAVEAYCKDIPSPLKWILPDYRAIEKRIDGIIRQVFGLPIHESIEVKEADLIMLATERRWLLPDDGKEWHMLKGFTPLDKIIVPTTPKIANFLFLKRFNELTSGC